MSSNRKRMSEGDVQRAEEFPLHHAVRRGNINIVEDLLKSGADPNQKDHRETTPIHHVNHFHEDADKMVHVLLKYGADMLSRDCYGKLPFEDALRLRSRKVCQTFVDWGFSLQKSHRMYCGKYELLSNVQLFQPGAMDVLQVLIDLGVDLSCTMSSGGETLLHEGMQSGASLETIKFLVRAGLSVNNKNCLGMTPLHMMRFTECNLDWNEEEKSRHSKLIRYFLHEGYEIDCQDMFGCTLVHYVISEMRQSSILKYLINHGADLNAKDRNGVTPLHLSCFWRNITSVKDMIEAGCSIGIQDDQGATVFHHTVFHNNPMALQYLLTLCEPCLVRKPDASGTTPLHLARYFGYVELVDLFEEYFKSLNQGFKKDAVPDVFPLKDEFDVFEQQEIDSMTSEDFTLKGEHNRTLDKLLTSPVVGVLSELDEAKEVQSAVNKLVEQVAVKMSKTCPLLSFVPKLSGSLSEGTKCGFPNEFDFMCTMVELSKCFQEPEVASSPPMFAQLQLRPKFSLPGHDVLKYVDKTKSLRSAKLMEDFTEELNQIFLSKDIWEGSSALSPVSFCEKGANATTIRVRWHGQVLKDMLIHIDMVPALYFPNFWPPNVCDTALFTSQMKDSGIHVVFALHNDRFFESQEKHFRLSFSLAETEIFRALPTQVRLGYVLAKAIRDSYVCPQIAPRKGVQMFTDSPSEPQLEHSPESNQVRQTECFEPSSSDTEWQPIPHNEIPEEVETELIEPEDKDIKAEKIITSYFLKNALFTLVNKAYQRELDVDLRNTSQDQVILWAKLIYDYTEECLTLEQLPSFFVHSCNLLTKAYDSTQHELVFKSGAEFEPLQAVDDDESQGDDDATDESTEEDVEHLRKLFVKMLKGILQSH